MKKLISLMLAAFCCCIFTAAASAETQAVVTEGSQPAVTEPSQPTEPVPVFSGTLRLEHDSLPTNKPVTVTVVPEGGTLGATEVIRWRVYKGTVSEADADPNIQWKDYAAPFAVADNMKVEAAVFSADGVKLAATSGEITCIDLIAPTAPTLQPSNTEWTKDPVTVTLSGGEDAQSGLLRLEYRLGAEGAWSEYTDAISVTARTSVYARSVDVAGNTSEPVVLDVHNFDTTAPDVTNLSVKVSAEGAPVITESGTFSKYYGSQVTVTIDGAADTESGVKTYQYQAVSGAESVAEDKWQTYDPEKKPVVPGDFCGYVHARAVDAVGNCSASVSSEGFVVDITPPVVENLKLSETAVTGSRVIVTFNVKDNYWLETVTVNGIYAGVYASSFTAFRNDDYLIVAVDKVGNRTEQLVQITNINTTPFTLLDTWKGMNSQDFTPASWSVAEKAANQLQTLITVEAPQAQVESAAGQLLTALEGLVNRGDGTLSLELIGRIREYDSELYTESSWGRVEDGITALENCLSDPESTQETVDNRRRALEQYVAELVNRADFTDLDRLIAQCENMDTDSFSDESCIVFNEALDEARELSRTDSGQEAADAAYQKLLDAMGSLEISEKGGFNFTPLVFVILGLLIIATASALFIVRMRAKEKLAALEDSAEDGDPVEADNSIGDIHFTDDAPADQRAGASAQQPGSYIGAPDEGALNGNNPGSSYIGGRKQN